VRGRIESVLDWATARGYRTGDNPARWHGHMDNLLPALKKKFRVKHHAALPFEQMGAFMATLRFQEGTAARALEFLILTAARTGEVISAKWDEIDLRAALWTVPAERTNYPREVCEMALAHTLSDQVEAAYRRGDLFNKRAELIRERAKHCDQIKRAAKVIPMRRKAKAGAA
jgi:integrase